jgi:diacylglycerol kinase (ATP)
MRTLIIAHPSVGVLPEKRAVVERIAAHIVAKGGSADTAYIMKPGMGMNLSSRAAVEGYDAILSAGGDGTINDVASGLVNRKIPLGVIPLGTGNGFARALDLPFDTDGIISMLDAGKTIALDAGRISSKYFFSVAGIGYDAFIAGEFNRMDHMKRIPKALYSIAIKQYFLHRSETLTLILDGKEMKRKVFGLTICNTGHYGAGAIISPSSNPSDGHLDAVLIPKFNVVSGLRAMFKLFDGTIENMRKIEYIPFTSLKIKRPRPGVFQVDGETFSGQDSLTVTALPHALRLIVP